jgi:hypothetical protein
MVLQNMQDSYSTPREAQGAKLVPGHTYSQWVAGEIVPLYHMCPQLSPGDILHTAAVAAVLGTGADGSDR